MLGSAVMASAAVPVLPPKGGKVKQDVLKHLRVLPPGCSSSSRQPHRRVKMGRSFQGAASMRDLKGRKNNALL